MKKQYKGIFTALVTPFKTDGSVDIEAYKEHVEFQIKSGVDGVVSCASTGEGATLDLDEYELLFKTALKQARKRVPVIAGASNNSTKRAVELSKIAKKVGANALLHTNPYYNKPTLSGLIAHFKAIAKASNLPIIIYNVPGRTAQNMSAETTLAIVKAVPQVVAIKEASGNIPQIMDIIKGAPEYFSVLSGDDSLTLPMMSLGADGVICTASNEIPKELSTMVHAALTGNFNIARKLHYKWLDLMNVNFIESNPIPVKTALAMMRKIKEVFRLPLTPITDKNRIILKNVLKQHKLI